MKFLRDVNFKIDEPRKSTQQLIKSVLVGHCELAQMQKVCHYRQIKITAEEVFTFIFGIAYEQLLTVAVMTIVSLEDELV